MGLNHFSDMTAKLPTFKITKCWQFFYFEVLKQIWFKIIINGKEE